MASQRLIVYLQQRAGSRRGARVLAYLIAWQTARDALGEDWPTTGITAEVEAYTEWWNQPLRTSWDELERFREVFPGQSPSQLLDQLQWDRRRGARALGAAPLPA